MASPSTSRPVKGKKAPKGGRTVKPRAVSPEIASIANLRNALLRARNTLEIKDIILLHTVDKIRQEGKREHRSRSISKEKKFRLTPEGEELLKNSFMGGMTREGFQESISFFERQVQDHLLAIDTKKKPFRYWSGEERRLLLGRRRNLLRAFSIAEREINAVRTIVPETSGNGMAVNRMASAMHHRIQEMRHLINEVSMTA